MFLCLYAALELHLQRQCRGTKPQTGAFLTRSQMKFNSILAVVTSQTCGDLDRCHAQPTLALARVAERLLLRRSPQGAPVQHAHVVHHQVHEVVLSCAFLVQDGEGPCQDGGAGHGRAARNKQDCKHTSSVRAQSGMSATPLLLPAARIRKQKTVYHAESRTHAGNTQKMDPDVPRSTNCRVKPISWTAGQDCGFSQGSS